MGSSGKERYAGISEESRAGGGGWRLLWSAGIALGMERWGGKREVKCTEVPMLFTPSQG